MSSGSAASFGAAAVSAAGVFLSGSPMDPTGGAIPAGALLATTVGFTGLAVVFSALE